LKSDSNPEATAADCWIKKLDLIEHPWGGFHREIYRK
jgi:predicted cupin superfamily sugar epimerase